MFHVCSVIYDYGDVVYYCLLLLFIYIASSNKFNIYICIDGGGSKTLLQVLINNKIYKLRKKDEDTSEIMDSIITGPSNINTVGKDGVQEVCLLYIFLFIFIKYYQYIYQKYIIFLLHISMYTFINIKGVKLLLLLLFLFFFRF